MPIEIEDYSDNDPPVLLVYGIVAMMYFAMCYPLTVCARLLERKLAQSR